MYADAPSRTTLNLWIIITYGFTIATHTSSPTVNTCQCISLYRVNYVRYLDVHIDDTLNWHTHIDYTCSRVKEINVMKNL